MNTSRTNEIPENQRSTPYEFETTASAVGTSEVSPPQGALSRPTGSGRCFGLRHRDCQQPMQTFATREQAELMRSHHSAYKPSELIVVSVSWEDARVESPA